MLLQESVISKSLVEDGIVDGWDDPRLVSIAALRQPRIYTGIYKDVYRTCAEFQRAQSSVDYAMLEYCIREDLKDEKTAYDGCVGSDQTRD